MQQPQPQQVKTVFDSKNQYERVLPHLLQGEALYFVFDLKGGGTGFIGISDRRIIFMDQNFLDRKDAAVVTIPYARISFVAIQTERKVLARDESSLTVAVTGKTFEFEFRGTDKAHKAAHAINFHICK